MASNTPNLHLYKKNPIEDQNDTFNIDTMLNNNWDKIDDAIGDIQNELSSDSIKTTYESNINTNAFTDIEKSKLAGVEANANNYHHPATHPASMINEETNRKFITDSEKTKLAGIESGAEVNNLSDANAADLTDGGDSSLHYHSNDRNRANHTGSQLASTISNFFSTVRGTVLTGLSTATNSAITATDSLLSALGKLQAQITSLETSKLDVDANAASASKLKTARTISLTGDVTGSVSFDGSANKTITTTVANDSHTHDSRYYTESEMNTKLGAKSDTNHNHNGVYEPANSNIFKKLADIGSGIDINTITADGYYHQNSNASAAAGTNYPVDYAGMLTVKTDGDMVYQTYQVYNSGEIWTRSKYNSIWYSWRKVWDSLNDGTGSGLDSDKLDGQHGSYYLNMDNMGESSTKKVMTNSERTKLAGIQTGAQVNRSISDSVTSTGSTTAASSNAVKTAYDKGVQALDTANTKLNSSGGTITGDLSVQGDIKLTSSDSMVIGSEGNDYIKFNPSTDALEVYSNTTKTLEVSESTIKYEGNDIWHAGNGGSGSGLDADVVDGKHASGTLNTAEKTNLVNAINEVNSKTTALESEISNNINQQSLTLTNADPTQHITSKQNCGVDVEIGGEMVVNLLGDCGSFKNDSNGDGVADGWTGWLRGAIPTIDNGRQKIETTIGDTSIDRYLEVINALEENKYYFAQCRVETVGQTSVARLRMLHGGLINDYSNVITGNNEGFLTVKFNVDDVNDWNAVRFENRTPVGDIGGTLFSNYMLIEITFDEYNNLTVDQLLAKYPYTNSAQPLLNPMVEVCGKNRFKETMNAFRGYYDVNGNKYVTSGENWVKIDGGYKTSDGANGLVLNDPILVKGGGTYTLNLNSNQSSKGYSVYQWDEDYKWVGRQTDITCGNPITLYADTKYIRIQIYSNTTMTNTEFTNIQLEQGTTPTPYEPYKGGQIIFPTELAKINTYQDKLTYKDGVAKVDREVKHVVLDGSANLAYNSGLGLDAVGYKRIILINEQKAMNIDDVIISKYDGIILKNDQTTSMSDSFAVNSGDLFVMFIAISDTDSGWGEDYDPLPEEIKAYFNGWIMCNADVWGTNYEPFNNLGNKGWVKRYCGQGSKMGGNSLIGDLVAGSNTTTLPTTINDMGYTPYQLYYALQNPVQEEILPITLGDGVNLVEGQNTLTVKSGVVWEKAKVYYDSATQQYQINRLNTSPSSATDYTAKHLIDIIKIVSDDGTIIKTSDLENWLYGDVFNSDWNGFFATKLKVQYESDNATYYVIYQVLQEDYNCQVQEVEVSYEDNIRGALNEVVEEVANVQQDISNLQLRSIDTNIKGNGESVESEYAEAIFSSSSTGSKIITFKKAFRKPPKVLTVSQSYNYLASPTEITTTGFTLSARKADNSPVTYNLPCYWIAIG